VELIRHIGYRVDLLRELRKATYINK
jgi:hypothetical protein